MKVVATLMVIGLQIAQPDPENKFGQSMVPGVQPGVTIHMKVTHPEKQLIEYDAKNCSMKTFVDDKGTDLMPRKEGMFGRPAWLGSFPDFSDDGRSVVFKISTKTLPAENAGQIKLQGTVAFLAGAGEKTEQAKLKLDVGEKIAIGPAPLEVSSIGEGWGEMKLKIAFKTDKPISAIKKIEFLDAEGNVIESRRSSTSRSGFGGKVKTVLTYQLKKKVDSLIVRQIYYTKVESVKIPIDKTVTLGL